MPPPPREYYVTLYQTGTISDTDISVARAYHVGKDEYGVWFTLAPGAYYLRIERGDDHIVTLAADGQYWTKSGLWIDAPLTGASRALPPSQP